MNFGSRMIFGVRSVVRTTSFKAFPMETKTKDCKWQRNTAPVDSGVEA